MQVEWIITKRRKHCTYNINRYRIRQTMNNFWYNNKEIKKPVPRNRLGNKIFVTLTTTTTKRNILIRKAIK